VRFRRSWRLLAAILAVGCAKYEPKPLTRGAVEQSLATPDADALRVRASEIRHPLLKPVPIDLSQGLTPDSAAVLAVVINPQLRAVRGRKALSSAQLLQAGLLPNPSLEFVLDPVTGGNTQGTVTAYSVGVNWEVTSLITHDAKLAAARASNRSVALDVAWQEWQFAQAAKKAVYDLAALRQQLVLARSMDEHLADNAKLIHDAVDAGQKTLIDLAAADSASQKAHADFLLTDQEARQQELLLKQAVGLPPEARIQLAPMPLPSQLELPSKDELLAGMEQRRLDLVALRHGYESQEQTLRAAVLAQFPKVVFGIHQASDNQGVLSTGIGLSVDLPILDQNQGQIAIEKATRQQLFDEYSSRIFEARSVAAQALDDIQSLSTQIAAAEAAIPALERLRQTYEIALDQHNVDVLSYYSAVDDLAQKQIDLLKLKQQLMDNRIALELATGMYLSQSGAATTPSSRPATKEAPR
jgi:cobalt-zinc-cadmium efflux system outer membrane protein